MDESHESTQPRGPRTAARLFGVLLVVLALVGGVWTVQGQGSLPGYGDSQHYYSLSLEGRTDPYRGWMYPHVVGWIAAPAGEVSRSQEGYLKFQESLSRGLRKLQWVQLAALGGALWLFLRALRVAPSPPWLALALFAALLFDPLVGHFSLAMMPDGFALAAGLVWCAGAADLLLRRGPASRALALILVGQLVSAGLRPEKNLVLLAAAAGTWLLAEVLARRGAQGALDARRGRLLLASALGMFALGGALQPSPTRTERRWPLETTLLHQRVVFPYLGEVLDELPAELRGGLDEPAAAFHDASLFQARQVVERLEELEPDVPVEERMRAWARQVWRRRALSILVDTCLDGCEALGATPAFYGHLSATALFGPEAVLPRHDPATDNTHRMHARMLEERPRFTNGLLLLAGATFLVGAILALRRGRPVEQAARAAWWPTLVFVLANAGAFAATQNLTQARYALLAHVALLTWVYARVLRTPVA